MKNKGHILPVILLTLLFVMFFAISVSADSVAYDLYVSGVQVNSNNEADVLGDGTVSYNSDTKTLTLNGATITDCYSKELESETMCVGIHTGINNLTINVIGTNTIDLITHKKNHEGNIGSAAIYSDRSLAIKGDGSLTIKAEFGISAMESISITDTTILSGSFFGISAISGDVKFTNATLKTIPDFSSIEGMAALIFTQSSNIILENTTLISNEWLEMSAIYTTLGSISINNSSITVSNVGTAPISAGSMEQSMPGQSITITNSQLQIGSDMMGIVSGGSLKMENVKGEFQLTKDLGYTLIGVTRLQILNCELDIYAVPLEDGSLGIGGQTVEIDDSNINITVGGSEGTFGIVGDGYVNITKSEVEIRGNSTAIAGIYSTNGNINITDSNVGISIVGTESEGLAAGIFTEKGYLTVNGGSLKITASAPLNNELSACIYTTAILPCKLINADVLLQGNKVFLIAPSFTEYDGKYEITASKNIDGSNAEEYSAENAALYQYFHIHPFYTVSFNGNGLGGSMESVTDLYGSYQLPVCGFNLTDDMFFLGWALSKDGEVISDPEIDVTRDITLYAIWSTDPNGIPSDHSHSYGDKYKFDAKNHWKACICGDKIMVSAHTDGNENGSCDVCGSVMPEEKGLGAGAIVAIVLGSVAVLGGGGFVIYWFVIRKKIKS